MTLEIVWGENREQEVHENIRSVREENGEIQVVLADERAICYPKNEIEYIDLSLE